MCRPDENYSFNPEATTKLKAAWTLPEHTWVQFQIEGRMDVAGAYECKSTCQSLTNAYARSHLFLRRFWDWTFADFLSLKTHEVQIWREGAWGQTRGRESSRRFLPLCRYPTVKRSLSINYSWGPGAEVRQGRSLKHLQGVLRQWSL